jgi:hypothetical protein
MGWYSKPEPIPLDTVRSMLRIAGCRQPAIRVRVVALQLSAANRVEHRDAARMCLMAEFRDCTTHARTSMSACSVQDASEHRVREECVQRNGSAIPFASRIIARASKTVSKNSLCECRKKKNPRMGIRGRSRSSEIGATDLQKEDQS